MQHQGVTSTTRTFRGNLEILYLNKRVFADDLALFARNSISISTY